MQERQEGNVAQEGAPELTTLRQEIEDVDQRILGLIALRCRLAEAAGERKRAAGLATVDPAQEAVVIRRAAVRARSENLDEEGVRQLFWCLISLSRAMQEKRSRGEGA
jgi:prephenate dehydrogenase